MYERQECWLCLWRLYPLFQARTRSASTFIGILRQLAENNYTCFSTIDSTEFFSIFTYIYITKQGWFENIDSFC